jgi:hypothetical protein
MRISLQTLSHLSFLGENGASEAMDTFNDLSYGSASVAVFVRNGKFVFRLMER